ncbi:MAG: hypothetical protein QM726_03640 [Chitinophagaceae bacterium]
MYKSNAIEAIILYCSLDRRFIAPCLENLLRTGFVSCHVIMYDHLYGGVPEDVTAEESFIRKSAEEWFNAGLVRLTTLPWQPAESTLYFEAAGRYYGAQQSTARHLLFIDADEIVDTVAFTRWCTNDWDKSKKAVKLNQYLYFIHPAYRLDVQSHNTVIADGNYARSLPLRVEARWNAYWNNQNRLSRWTAKLGLNPYFSIQRGTPFIHHFTYVRTKAEMLKKVANWSHNKDHDNWAELIEQLYANANKHKIGGHGFTHVENVFDIDTTDLFTIKEINELQLQEISKLEVV